MLRASDVAVAVLTGLRPYFTAGLFASTREVCPGLLETATVLVHHNTGDEETVQALSEHADVIDETETTDTLWSIGGSTSRLVERVQATGCRYVLNLQDDFHALALPGAEDWLTEARALVDSGVGQVLLRVAKDGRTSNEHRVTRERLRWEPLGPHRLCAEGEFTFNPTLMLVEDLHHAFPAATERDAAIAWYANRYPSEMVQYVPGVWTHLGNQRRGLSLKAKHPGLNRPDG